MFMVSPITARKWAGRYREEGEFGEAAQRDGYCGGRVNSSRNNASERSKPSLVRINDFDLLTRSPIMPFL